MVFGWLQNNKGEIIKYDGFEKKGNKLRTDMGMEYPVTWLKTDISENKKRRFAEDLRKVYIEDIYCFTKKDPTYSKEAIKKMVEQEKQRSWENIISEYIENVKEKCLSNYAQSKNYVLLDGYKIGDFSGKIFVGENTTLSLDEVSTWLEAN